MFTFFRFTKVLNLYTLFMRVEATADRQAGLYPEPGAALSSCSRRRCFIPAAVPGMAYLLNANIVTINMSACKIGNLSVTLSAGYEFFHNKLTAFGSIICVK